VVNHNPRFVCELTDRYRANTIDRQMEIRPALQKYPSPDEIAHGIFVDRYDQKNCKTKNYPGKSCPLQWYYVDAVPNAPPVEPTHAVAQQGSKEKKRTIRISSGSSDSLVSTARRRLLRTASSSEEKLAATSQHKSCEKAYRERNAANRGSGISRKCAVYKLVHVAYSSAHSSVVS